MKGSIIFAAALIAFVLLSGQLQLAAGFPTATSKLLRRQDNAGNQGGQGGGDQGGQGGQGDQGGQGGGGDQAGSQEAPSPPSPPPEGVQAFPENTRQTSLWALISGNPSFSNFSQLIATHDPALISSLNAQVQAGGPPYNLTVLAPPDSAFEDLVQSPFWELLMQPVFAPIARQLIGLHVHNGTAITSDQVPPQGQGNVTVDSLSTFGNITLQYAAERPSSGMPGSAPIAPPPQDNQEQGQPQDQGQQGQPDQGQPDQGQNQGEQGQAPPDQPDVGGDQAPPPDSNPALPPPAPGPDGNATAPPPNNGTANNTQLYANAAQVVYKDVLAANGVLHVVDQVLTPFFGRANGGSLSSLIFG